MKKLLFILPIVITAISSLTLFDLSEESNDVKSNFSTFSIYGINDKECTFCHNDILKHTFMHAPVSDDCMTCHQSTGNTHPRVKLQGFTLTEKSPDLCYICHETKNEKSVIHAPVESGECSSCHSPHGSEYKYFLPKSTTDELCAECHDTGVKENPIIHGAIELDGCATCHNPHESDFSYLLNSEKIDLCMTCHDGISDDKKAKYQHAPFDDCSNCHNSHSSKYNFLLTSSREEICFTCHDDIASNMKDAKYVHDIVTDEKGCNNCHSPHASNYTKLLVKENNDLCFSCHNEEIKTEKKTIENIGNKIKADKFIHAPVESGCNECHDPHTSSYISLLKDMYPEKDYAEAKSENFQLCFNCHDPEIINENSEATNFRNGEQNLHFVHINGPKGRKCSICHDVHASNNDHLVKDRTKFGTWDMPLNYIRKEDGGSCRTGCHTELSYSRGILNIINNTNINNHVSDTTSNIVINKNFKDSVFVNQNTKDTTHLIKNIEDNNNANIVIIKDTAENIINNNIAVNDDNTAKDTTSQINEDNNLITEDNNITEDGNNVITENNNVTVEDTTSQHNDNANIITEDNTNAITEDNNVTVEDTTSQQNDNTNIIAEDNTNVITEDNNNDVSDSNNIEEKDDVKKAFKAIMPFRIYFKYASSEFNTNFEKDIDLMKDFLKSYPNANIIIEGHTDSKGSDAYNLNLSKSRAEAVKSKLVNKGIASKRLIIRPLGERKPEFTNETEEGRSKNRRVQFKLSETN